MGKIYKIIFFVSMGLAVISAGIVFVYGIKFGVDFRGGSVLELEFDQRPSITSIQNVINIDGEVAVNYFGDKGIIIKLKELTENEHQVLIGKVKDSFGLKNVEEKRFESVGPIIGQELKRKSIIAIFLVLVSIVVYIAYVFRKLSSALSPWAMGVAAIIALAHDVIIPLGIFSVLGKFYGIEVTAIFVAAILTILGYSVSDTVVVFDRIRENVIRNSRDDFDATVHKSIMQTLIRSLNTTITTLLSLMAIYFFGGESIKYFSLMLIIGIFLGAYSSIFVASPLLVAMHKSGRKHP